MNLLYNNMALKCRFYFSTFFYLETQLFTKELSSESTLSQKPGNRLVPKAIFSPSVQSLNREQRTFLHLSRGKPFRVSVNTS